MIARVSPVPPLLFPCAQRARETIVALLEHISGVALGFQSSGDEEMLGPYVVVLQAFRFLLGVVQQAGRLGGGVDLIGLAG